MKKNTAKDFLDLYFNVKNRNRKDAIYAADHDIADHYGYIYNGDTDLRSLYEEYKFYTHEDNPDVTDLFAAIQDEAEKYREASYKKQEATAERLIQEVQDGAHDGLCKRYYEYFVLERPCGSLSVRPDRAVDSMFYYSLISDEGLKEQVRAVMLRHYDGIYQEELKEQKLQEEAEREEKAKQLEAEKERRKEWKRRMAEKERQRNFWK